MSDVVRRAAQQEAEDQAIARASVLWPKAVTFLRNSVFNGIASENSKKIRAAIAANPDGWIGPYHFGWGMAIRNELRNVGYGEHEFGIQNLDNIYVPLIEEAVAE